MSLCNLAVYHLVLTHYAEHHIKVTIRIVNIRHLYKFSSLFPPIFRTKYLDFSGPS
jgi:hypothetical protein